MGDNEQNATRPADDQATSNTEGSDEQEGAVSARPATERQQAAGAAAPADDDIIIK